MTSLTDQTKSLTTWKDHIDSRFLSYVKATDGKMATANQDIVSLKWVSNEIKSQLVIGINDNKENIDKTVNTIESYKRTNDETIQKLRSHVSDINSWKLNMKSQFCKNLKTSEEHVQDLQRINEQVKDLKLFSTKHESQLSNQIEAVSFLRGELEGVEDRLADNEHR